MVLEPVTELDNEPVTLLCTGRSGELRASLEKDSALEALEELKEQELITEENYNARRAEIEHEFEAERTANEQRTAGQRLFIQQEVQKRELELRKSELEQLIEHEKAQEELRRQSLRRQLAQAEAEGDDRRAQALQKVLEFDSSEARANHQAELGKVSEDILKQGDILSTAADLMKEGINESLGSLFDGDLEGTKENMKSVLTLLIGFLEKLASAAVLELVLEPTFFKSLAAAAGPFAPIVLAGATQLISSGVRAILNPIISSIASFATGGVFTQPTLALVGDASRLGGSNTEYLLRNDQMKAVMREAISSYESSLVYELRSIGAKFDRFEGRLRVECTDLVTATTRTIGRHNSRARRLNKA